VGTQTFADRADCGTLNGTACDAFLGRGKLEGCEKKSVPTTFIRDELMWGDRPVVIEQ
jgi:hypothetical protein